MLKTSNDNCQIRQVRSNATNGYNNFPADALRDLLTRL